MAESNRLVRWTTLVVALVALLGGLTAWRASVALHAKSTTAVIEPAATRPAARFSAVFREGASQAMASAGSGQASGMYMVAGRRMVMPTPEAVQNPYKNRISGAERGKAQKLLVVLLALAMVPVFLTFGDCLRGRARRAFLAAALLMLAGGAVFGLLVEVGAL